MKTNNFKLIRFVVAFITINCCIFALFGTMQVGAVEEKGTIDYVSFGASNVNGYGMRGYLGQDSVYDTPWLKDGINIYGYKQQVEGSYPDLIADMIEEAGFMVNRHEMGISSMRAEELRFLLDDTYRGDKYTDWRFYDLPEYSGRGNWFYGAGKLEWFARGNTTEPTQEQAIAALKDEYRQVIKDAEFITLDMGINNFGVYVSNQIGSNKYGNDMAVIDPEVAEKYELGKEYVLDIIKQYAGDLPMVDSLESFVDTMAYALVGFCLNFDIIMEKIRELNPDVQVVVVSIQNLMEGLDTSLPGVDQKLPLDDIFGAVINAANIYTAILSPYANDYYYADVRQNGHVDFYMNKIEKYDGNPETLDQNIKDCFDVYDNDLFVKSRIQQFLMASLAQDPAYSSYIVATPTQLNVNDLTSVEWFMYGLNEFQGQPLIGFDFNGDRAVDLSFMQFLAMGKAGTLSEVPNVGPILVGLYDQYDRALTIAYDAMAEYMREAMKYDTIDLGSVSQSFGPVEDMMLMTFFELLIEGIGKGLADPSYQFTLSEECPEGLFEVIAEKAKAYNSAVTNELVYTIAALGVRTSIGNSFYGHPTPDGHIEIKDAIVAAVENKTTGKDAIIKVLEDATASYHDRIIQAYNTIKGFIERLGATETIEHFNVTDTTKYLALGDSLVTGKGVTKPATQSYPALLASALGVNNSEQYTNLGIDGIRANELHYILNPEAELDTYYTDKISTYVENAGGLEALREKVIPAVEEADIITLQVGANNYSNFVVDQLMAYIQGNEMYEMDWDKYSIFNFSELSLMLKTKYRDNLYQYLSENGVNIPEENRAMLETLIDIFLYSSIDYVVNMEATMAKIREYNEDAFIVVLGTYNPLKGVYYEAEGTERLELGLFLDEVIALIDDYLVQLANDYDNCVYVDISETTLLVDQYSIISKNFAETTKVAGYDVPLPKFLSYTMTNSFRMLH
ncbi:MAG: hypothetical protein IJX78_04455, partial [Bacilli bacterium]|nr:hypothetical protein [Bacilli bacterium]